MFHVFFLCFQCLMLFFINLRLPCVDSLNLRTLSGLFSGPTKYILLKKTSQQEWFTVHKNHGLHIDSC